jgi:hypothetical protein
MPEYKNQHYVPQFYLRAFSFDGGTNIALFNFKQNKIIPFCSIKDQCSEDYFYGKDPKPEMVLNTTIETPASQIIGEVIQNEIIPNPYTEGYAILAAFALFQHSRTLYTSEEGAELFRLSLQPIIKQMALQSGKFTREEVDAVQFEMEKPANLTIATAAELFPLVLDLKIKLLVNQTSQDFITSDHPVAKINQYFLGNYDGGVAGWGAKGLQVFVPLSPKHMVILYDDKIYKVGARKPNNVFITNEADVHALNKLQLLNAHENVYFRNSNQGWHISKMFESCRGLRKEQMVITRTFNVTDSEGKPAKVQHTHPQNLSFHESLSFCKVQTAKKQIQPQTREYGSRQPGLVKAQKKFLDEVDAGKYKPEDSGKYLDDILARM